MNKPFFLILTLAIPVAIFLFLKIFGTNTYEVPVLFDAGIPGCNNLSNAHIVPEFVYLDEHLGQKNSSELRGFLVFGALNGAQSDECRERLVELVRIQDAFFEVGAPKFILFNSGQSNRHATFARLCNETGLEPENRIIAHMPKDALEDYLKCGIALLDNSGSFDNLVLVDPDRKIRGIYKSNDVAQTDRLILELKILKQKNDQ
ncbi:MAG: hypothetical protein MI975_18450 [Cytophagales bacterium]|nr:hypothetical protein [Cytophagales bacterium]